MVEKNANNDENTTKIKMLCFNFYLHLQCVQLSFVKSQFSCASMAKRHRFCEIYFDKFLNHTFSYLMYPITITTLTYIFIWHYMSSLSAQLYKITTDECPFSPGCSVLTNKQTRLVQLRLPCRLYYVTHTVTPVHACIM